NANLTYTIVAGPAHGGLTGSGGSRTYTPAANFNGSDSFTYKVTDRGAPDNCAGGPPSCDGALSSDTKTISITVNPVNDKPVATDGSATLNEDGSTSVDLSSLHSALPTSNANLTYTIVAGPAHGGLTGSGGSRTYTPA